MDTNKFFSIFLAASIFSVISLEAICQSTQQKINYKSFTLNAAEKRIMIDWIIDSNISTNYFEIERSEDGKNFKTVTMVLGADPKQPTGNVYEGFDKPNKTSKKYFYRLKHVSLNGEIEVSEIKMIAFK